MGYEDRRKQIYEKLERVIKNEGVTVEKIILKGMYRLIKILDEYKELIKLRESVLTKELVAIVEVKGHMLSIDISDANTYTLGLKDIDLLKDNVLQKREWDGRKMYIPFKFEGRTEIDLNEFISIEDLKAIRADLEKDKDLKKSEIYYNMLLGNLRSDLVNQVIGNVQKRFIRAYYRNLGVKYNEVKDEESRAKEKEIYDRIGDLMDKFEIGIKLGFHDFYDLMESTIEDTLYGMDD